MTPYMVFYVLSLSGPFSVLSFNSSNNNNNNNNNNTCDNVYGAVIMAQVFFESSPGSYLTNVGHYFNYRLVVNPFT